MLFALPFWLWVLWVVVFIASLFNEGSVRGAASTAMCFFAYITVRYFTPQLGPWEQYGVYMLVSFLVGIAGLTSRVVKFR